MSNDKVRWGVIGATSRIAREAVLPAICNCPEAELWAVASRNLENAKDVATECGENVIAYGDYDSLIADPHVDVVYIPLPNNLHLGWAVEAMNNGKHVLCEQPLAMNAAEALEMVETAEDNGVILSDAFMYRYHPLQQEVFARISRGDIGEVRLVRASFSFVQTEPDDYRRDPGRGGGALLDVGGYCVHIARAAFGREPTAATAKSVLAPESGIDTTTTAQLDFDDNGTALIDCSFALTFRSSYEIVGSHGSITVPQFFALGGKSAEYLLCLTGQEPQTVNVSPRNMYEAEVSALSRRVRGESVFLLSPEDGLRNMRVLDAIAASARTGEKVSL